VNNRYQDYQDFFLYHSIANFGIIIMIVSLLNIRYTGFTEISRITLLLEQRCPAVRSISEHFIQPHSNNYNSNNDDNSSDNDSNDNDIHTDNGNHNKKNYNNNSNDFKY
jgi:hypothetical protein